MPSPSKMTVELKVLKRRKESDKLEQILEKVYE